MTLLEFFVIKILKNGLKKKTLLNRKIRRTSCLVNNISMCRKGGASQLHGTEAPASRPFQTYPVYLFVQLFTCILYSINVSKVLPLVL